MKIKNINVHLTEEELDKRIREMAAQISKDFDGEPITLICILKGSVFFTCDLAKRISNPVELDFMKVSSYGSGYFRKKKSKVLKALHTVRQTGPQSCGSECGLCWI